MMGQLADNGAQGPGDDRTARAPARLTGAAVVGIGSGDFGLNLYWQTAGLYLFYFYTDILHLPPAQAGAIYMGALIWDAMLDPVVGAFADNTRTKFGRYRPYLTFGSLVLAVCFVLMFLTPGHPASWAIAAAAVTHVLFRTSYAVVSVPYSTLSARVTRNTDDRIRLSVARMLSAIVGTVVVATATFPAADLLGGRLHPALAWGVVAGVYAVVATVALLLTSRAARQYDIPAFQDAAVPSLRQKLHAASANGPMLILIAATMVTSFSSTIFQKGLIYYFKYVMADAQLGSLAIGFTAVVAGISVPLWGMVAKRRSKRAAWLLGLIPGFIGLAIWHLADGRSASGLFCALAFMAVGLGSGVMCFWAMVPDTVEYAEWRTGIRSESLVFGLVIFGQKIALGGGAGLLGLYLARTGYVADTVQSAGTLAQLRDVILFAPLIGMILTAGLLFLYPLSPARHKQMVAEIAARKR
jgi:glycoside/pentoside/hexuronide:cation symporter, GPH family